MTFEGYPAPVLASFFSAPFMASFKVIDCAGTPGSSTGLASEALARFKLAERKSGRPIRLESGTRSVRRQAELWIGYQRRLEAEKIGAALGGLVHCHQARYPGASLHNHGYAIDVAEKDDSALGKALAESDWEQSVEGENWHWECTKAKGYVSAKARAEVIHNGVAQRWVDKYFEFGASHVRFAGLIRRGTPLLERLKALNAQARLPTSGAASAGVQGLADAKQAFDQIQSQVGQVRNDLQTIDAALAGLFAAIEQAVADSLKASHD